MASSLVIKKNMKKIIYIAAFLCFSVNAKSQTRIIVNGDTCVKVTATKIDTFSRKVIKQTLAELIEMKSTNIDEKRKAMLEFDRMNDFYTSEITRFRALKTKTD